MSSLRIGVDIGGSGIKGALVDIDSGELLGERTRLATPREFGVDDIVDTVAAVVSATGHEGPVGVGFPGVVSHGIVRSPPTAHEFEGWVDTDLGTRLAERIGSPVTVANDVDVAGTAEMHFGAARGRNGVVIVLALGTGVGSALFVDGVIVPNTEFGKLFLDGHDQVAEHHVADRVRDAEGLSWNEWGDRLQEYLQAVDRLFTPDLVILGGGVSKKHDHYLDRISIRCEVLPAELRNHAGIIGAALLSR